MKPGYTHKSLQAASSSTLSQGQVRIENLSVWEQEKSELGACWDGEVIPHSEGKNLKHTDASRTFPPFMQTTPGHFRNMPTNAAPCNSNTEQREGLHPKERSRIHSSELIFSD